MKEELLKMAPECLSEEEVKEILKKKFKESIESAIESAFRWGKVESALKKKIDEVMVPYIEKYDFSEYLPRLDTVLTEIESMKNDAYETLKEEKKRHGASKTAEELESYIYGLTCAVDIVEKYVDKENVE